MIFLNTTEQTHQQDLERLKSLRYMDDDFMTVCLADNFEGVELILQIVLGKKDIKIKSVQTQARHSSTFRSFKPGTSNI